MANVDVKGIRQKCNVMNDAWFEDVPAVAFYGITQVQFLADITVTANSALRATVNQMGVDGWELINVTPVQTGHQYGHPEGKIAGVSGSVYEERILNDFVISFLGSFRRSIE